MTIPHSTDLYAPAGKGKLYIAEWSGTTPPTWPGSSPTDYPTATDITAGLGDFLDVGNCPSLEVEPVTERRPHYSSREGVNKKDLNPVTSLDYTVSFELDEIAAQNLKKILMGTYTASTGIISAMTDVDKEYAMIFIANNPIGPLNHFYFRRLTIAPNGPMQLIGDEYLTLSYTGEGLADTVNHPNSEYFDIKNVTTTTTSTTTTTTA